MAVTGLATLLVLADGRLPAGGHAHSGGVEAAVAAGRVTDLSTLEAFLRGRLATAGLTAAAFAAATTHRLGTPQLRSRPEGSNPSRSPSSASPTSESPSDGKPLSPRPSGGDALVNSSAIGELDAGLDARTPSPALRKASRAQGRALMRAGRAMWTLPAGVPADGPHHAVALGIVAAAAGLDAAHAALVAAYGSVSGPASAAVRVLALDPYPVHALLARLAPACDETAARAARYADRAVPDLPAPSAPLLDITAEHHATWEVRLFAS